MTRRHPLIYKPLKPHVGLAFELSLAVARAQAVEVGVYDVLGRRVAVLFAGALEANRTRVLVWEADLLAGGLYVVRAEGEDFAPTRSVLVQR